jgi:hypothetical protein
MIKYLIIDDEYIAHDIIKGYCDLLPNMQLMKNCYDALKHLNICRKWSRFIFWFEYAHIKKDLNFKNIKYAPKSNCNNCL